MYLLIYTVFIILTVFIVFIKETNFKKNEYYDMNIKSTKISIINDKKVSLLSVLLLALIFSIFSANLAVSGKLTDTVRYSWSFLHRYPNYYKSFESFINAKTEPGFLLITMIIGKITNKSFWVFFLISMLTTSINIYCLFKFNKKYTFMIFMYLISLYFFQTTYLLRQTIAVSLGSLALLSYLENNWRRYFLFSIIALMFHTTAIILFPLFFMYKIIERKPKYYYIIIIIALSITVFPTSIINVILSKTPYIGQYINVDNVNIVRGSGSIMAILKGSPFYFITILSLFKKKTLEKTLYNSNFYILSSLIVTISWISTYNNYWFFRFGWYFWIPTFALIPNLFKTLRNPKERVLYYFVFISMIIFITYRQMYITLY